MRDSLIKNKKLRSESRKGIQARKEICLPLKLIYRTYLYRTYLKETLLAKSF